MSEPEWGNLAAGLRRGGPIIDPDPAPAFIDWADFFSRDRSDPEWLFEGVVARGRLHSVYARGGTGKSEFMLWVALQIIDAGGVVVMCDYEMTEDDLFDRLTDMGATDPDRLARLRYLLLPALPPLNTAAGAQALMDVVDGVAVDYPDRHVAVVIDTIARAVVGEENSNDTIQEFYRHTGLGLKQRGVACVRLDHSGHQGDHARGGSAKRDDVDVEWRLSRVDGGIELRADKRRMSWVPEKVIFDRVEDPVLSYRRSARSWPAGTAEAAAVLDVVGVPLNCGRDRARRLVKEAGRKCPGNAVLSRVLEFRRVEAQRLVERGFAAYRDDGERVEEL